MPLDRIRVSHIARTFDEIADRNTRILDAQASDDPDVSASWAAH